MHFQYKKKSASNINLLASTILTTACILTLPLEVLGQNVGKLPSFNIYTKRVTLSGFSSGGSFAQMFQISHSSIIHGVGVFGHTYYRCGPPTGKVDDYDRVCTKLFNYTEDQLYKPEKVHADIRDYHSKGLIDDPANLRNKHLYVYASLRNFLFTVDQSMSILKVYEQYIRNPKKILTRVQDAELLLPTNNPFGRPCTERADNKSFIGNCGFSGAYEALNFLHGLDHTVERNSGESGNNLQNRLKAFDQRDFLHGLKNPQMDSMGYYFVPRNCVKRKCLLHFYFHGCLTGREFEGTTHILNSGYLEVADASDIVLIFPQALKSDPENDIGCWDTFGISGPLYATKRGEQIIAVKRMLDKALGIVTSHGSTESHSSGWPSGHNNNGQNKGSSINSPGWSSGRPSISYRKKYKQGYGYYG